MIPLFLQPNQGEMYIEESKNSEICSPCVIESLNSSDDVALENSSAGYWISSLGLFEGDREILNGDDYLNDNIIQVAQTLLKCQFDFGGLQSPQNGKELNIKYRQKCIQVLHVGNIHWLAFSNVDVGREVVSDDTVYIYDSFIPTKVDLYTKKQVCSLLKPKMGQEIRFDFVDVMPQSNLKDCALFALERLPLVVILLGVSGILLRCGHIS